MSEMKKVTIYMDERGEYSFSPIRDAREKLSERVVEIEESFIRRFDHTLSLWVGVQEEMRDLYESAKREGE